MVVYSNAIRVARTEVFWCRRDRSRGLGIFRFADFLCRKPDYIRLEPAYHRHRAYADGDRQFRLRCDRPNLGCGRPRHYGRPAAWFVHGTA